MKKQSISVQCKVILEKSIAECILKSGNDDEQYQTVKYQMIPVPLEHMNRRRIWRAESRFSLLGQAVCQYPGY